MGTAQTTREGEEPTFQLGLALAGAISAGAYTAGVLDFLFQALSEWEKAKATNEAGVAKHSVAIKVMAGASAGAITGALGAISLARGLAPRTFTTIGLGPADFYPDNYKTHQKYQCVLPSLYKTWVTLPAMVSADGKGGFLSTDDITSDKKSPVRSFLNSSTLDDIKRGAIEPFTPDDVVQDPVAFIAKRLHIYTTVSNMRGIPFRVEFGRGSYGMQTIGDRVHYVVNGLGSRDLAVAGSWVECDAEQASLPISVGNLPKKKGDPLSDWDLYGTCALASGAFPIGLAPRKLSFPWQQYMHRRYPLPLPDTVSIQPNIPDALRNGEFVFESVDGGLVNNSPFDYAQYALVGHAITAPVDGTEVDRAIIMVAPFPDPPEILPEGTPASTVVGIARALFPALVNQARFRASDLTPAFNDRDFGRYLIAPMRRIPRESGIKTAEASLERFSIACGLLGGFGGFLDEKFRAHDFQLGRRNCQRFLQSSFLVPGDNKIVKQGSHENLVPVIPLCGSALAVIQLPVWPKMSLEASEQLNVRTAERVDAVVPRLIEAATPRISLQLALKFGWHTFLSAPVKRYIQQTILTDLVRRNQIEEWDLPPEIRGQHKEVDVSAILAELVNPAFDFRTAKAISMTTALDVDDVRSILTRLLSKNVPEQMRVWQDGSLFTLMSRRPNFLKRLGVVKWFDRWWNAPVIS